MRLTKKHGESLGFKQNKKGRWMLDMHRLNPVLLAELMLHDDNDDDDETSI